MLELLLPKSNAEYAIHYNTIRLKTVQYKVEYALYCNTLRLNIILNIILVYVHWTVNKVKYNEQSWINITLYLIAL